MMTVVIAGCDEHTDEAAVDERNYNYGAKTKGSECPPWECPPWECPPCPPSA